MNSNRKGQEYSRFDQYAVGLVRQRALKDPVSRYVKMISFSVESSPSSSIINGLVG